MANNRDKCLIIGGNGFLGVNLANQLLEKGYSIRILDLNNNNILKFVKNKVEFVGANLLDREKIKLALRGVDIIFYFASSTNVISSIQDAYNDNQNIIFALNILEEAKEANIKRIVFASSGGTVYGEPLYLPIDEDHRTKPISPYGITKLSIENYLHYYNVKYGLDYLICRYSNPYGTGQSPYGQVGAITIFLYKHLIGDKVTIYGIPSSIIRDYIYVTDMIEATIQLTFKKNLNYKIYNIGSGIGTSLQDVLDGIEMVTNKRVDIIVNENKRENVSKIILDINRITKEIKWTPKINLKEGIELSYKSMLENK